MSTGAQTLIGLGISPEVANRMGNTVATYAGSGTAQNGPTTVTTNVALLTTAGSQTAVTLSTKFAIGDTVFVANTSSTTGLVFPQTGGAIDGGSANASVSVAQNKSRLLLKVSSTDWRSVAGA